jgi:hypothetical protein
MRIRSKPKSKEEMTPYQQQMQRMFLFLTHRPILPVNVLPPAKLGGPNGGGIPMKPTGNSAKMVK